MCFLCHFHVEYEKEEQQKLHLKQKEKSLIEYEMENINGKILEQLKGYDDGKNK